MQKYKHLNKIYAIICMFSSNKHGKTYFNGMNGGNSINSWKVLMGKLNDEVELGFGYSFMCILVVVVVYN